MLHPSKNAREEVATDELFSLGGVKMSSSPCDVMGASDVQSDR